MATLLGKILPSDIAQHIYFIALNDYIQNKIIIFSYNIFLIFEKHFKIIKNDKKNYNLYLLFNTDINRIISVLNFVKINFIDPYKKWNINFEKKYIDEVKCWSSKILGINTKYIDDLQSNIGLEYKLLINQKILIESIDKLLNN
jgi:hypothetical protein